MATAQKQKLVWGILDFLQTSLNDGTVKEEDKEGLEIAMQCIGEAFNVNQTESTHSIKPITLMQIFSVYAQMQEKRGGGAAPAAAAASTSASAAPKEPTPEDKSAAEALKTSGNQLMANKKYAEAIAKYGAAIDLNPNSPVYYSNRAAAYSQAGDHGKAIDDAKKAAEVDPTFSKAYSRLGHALFSSGRFQEAVDAYEKGLELDPANQSMKNSLATAKSRAAASLDDEDDEDDVAAPAARGPAGGAGGMPDLSSLLGGLGGGRGGGGMPDLASLMNNPQLMAMASQMMQNGGMERLMQNPQLRQMAEQFQSGGGMPSMEQMSQMYNDPAIRDAAAQFGRGRGQGSGGSGGNMYS